MESEKCTKLGRIKRRDEEGKLRWIKMVRGEGYERIWGEGYERIWGEAKLNYKDKRRNVTVMD